MTIEFKGAPWDGAQFHAPLTPKEYHERCEAATRRALRDLKQHIPKNKLKSEKKGFWTAHLPFGLASGAGLVLLVTTSATLVPLLVKRTETVRILF
jgi:hypothetical protein